MTPEAHSASLAAAGVSAEVAGEKLGVVARVAPKDVAAALTALRDGDGAFTYMVDLFATDTGEAVDVTYHLRSFASNEDVYLRTTAAYGGKVDSAWRVFPAALYPEREAAELFGLHFPGHPNPKRLLTTDEVEAPLLLKSVQIRTDEEVHR